MKDQNRSGTATLRKRSRAGHHSAGHRGKTSVQFRPQPASNDPVAPSAAEELPARLASDACGDPLPQAPLTDRRSDPGSARRQPMSKLLSARRGGASVTEVALGTALVLLGISAAVGMGIHPATRGSHIGVLVLPLILVPLGLLLAVRTELRSRPH